MWKFKIQNYICPAQILSSPSPCQDYHGKNGSEIQTFALFRSVCEIYSGNYIQVMFSRLNSSLRIHCMLNLTSADSYTPVPYSPTCANAWMIHFPHVSSQKELCPSSWGSCSLCLICTDPKSDPCWQMTTADLQVKPCSSPTRSQSSAFLQDKPLCQMLRTNHEVWFSFPSCRPLQMAEEHRVCAQTLSDRSDRCFNAEKCCGLNRQTVLWVEKHHRPKHNNMLCPKALQHYRLTDSFIADTIIK